MSQRYYVRHPRKPTLVKGPVTIERLRSLVDEGRVKPEHEISQDGNTWTAVAKLRKSLLSGTKKEPSASSVKPTARPKKKATGAETPPGTSDNYGVESGPTTFSPKKKKRRRRRRKQENSLDSFNLFLASVFAAVGFAVIGFFLFWVVYAVNVLPPTLLEQIREGTQPLGMCAASASIVAGVFGGIMVPVQLSFSMKRNEAIVGAIFGAIYAFAGVVVASCVGCFYPGTPLAVSISDTGILLLIFVPIGSFAGAGYGAVAQNWSETEDGT